MRELISPASHSNCHRSSVALAALLLAGCESDPITFTRPTICVRPEAVSFGEQLVRTAATRVVAVTNCGSSSIERVDARLVTTTSSTPFAIDATVIPTPLGPSAFFRLGLRYRPIVAEHHEAILEISTDGFPSEGEVVSVALDGTAVLPAACAPVLDPAAIFETTLVGQTRDALVGFKNEGTGACRLSGARVRGSDVFSVVDVLDVEVGPGERQDISVRFAPRTEGDFNAELSVIVEGDLELSADLSGDAERPVSCTLLARPAAVVFPRAILDTLDTTSTFEIESIGEVACTIAAVEITAGADALSVLRAPASGTVLATATSTAIELEFSPEVLGPHVGTLAVRTEEGFVLEVPISATADPRPSCALRFDPSPLTFAPLAVGLEAEAEVEITNLSALDCEVSDVRLAAAELTLVGADPRGLLLAGEQRTIRVHYRPTIAAPTISQLEVELDGGAVQVADVVGFAAFADLRLTPGLGHLGIVTEGCASAPTRITLTNVGPVAARVDRIGFSATTDPNFQLLDLFPTPFLLGPSESRLLDVRMLGAAVFSGQTAELEVQSTGTADALVRSSMRGTSESTTAASRREVFIQSEQRSVDILFVIDNSGSMGEEQTNLRQNFQSFIDFFTNQIDVDFHLGVTTTDTAQSGLRGALVGPYIDDFTPNPATIFSTQANVGTSGSADEEGLKAAVQAVSSPNTDSGGPNDGFLREDALLSIIYITDEDDRSDGAVSVYLDQLLAAKGYRSELVITSAIAGNVPSGCASAVAGFRYYDIVQATQLGIFESICTADWALTMQQLGFSTFAALTRFKLGREPGVGTIVVEVDGLPVPMDPNNGWTYDPITNAIVFHGSAVPDAGEEIGVNYDAECLPI